MICLIGTVLKDRYCVMERIGQGGGGSLYLARDMELGVFRAVKETSIIRKQEAKLMRLLEHPAIPKIVDYVEEEEFCYLIMEYIRGKSLGQLCEEGYKFSAEELLSYGDTILQVLEYLHKQKPPVYYGDLKPDNLMLSESGKLYLVDFGSAVFGFGDFRQVCMGTEGFAAPEQYEGIVNNASDLYALGKTMQALVGKRWPLVLWKVPGLGRFIYKCIQPQEKRRFQSASQARKMLSDIGKRKGQTRKNIGIAVGTAGVLLAAGMLMAGQESRVTFQSALTEVTEGYYELAQEEQWEQREGGPAKLEQVEAGLQKMQTENKGDDEQRKLLLLLAANAELSQEWERAAVYYEQLLLYAPDYPEGYGKYGLFLLRRGQKRSARRLLALYKSSGAGKDACESVKLWEEKMKHLEGEEK